MKRKTKLLSALLTLTMGIATMGALTGCKGDNQNSSSSSSVDSSPDENKQETPSPTEGLVYTLSEDGMYYSVTDYKGTDTNIYIPNAYKGLPVKEIGDRAFKFCSELTQIIIPERITYIGDDAFTGCTRLTQIIVNENNTRYKSIDGNLYSKNGWLLCYAYGKKSTTFVIPDGVTNIGRSAFEHCNYLTEVVIPNSVRTISENAFNDCNNLTSIAIPNSVTSIGECAFGGCNLTEILISDSVTTIGQAAFSWCFNLTIYCKAKSKPNGWHSNWNPSNCPVVWGYTNEN